MLSTDTKYKCVEWVPTFTGRLIYPRAPTVESITIIDIAHHLSNQCRYSGATNLHYSVAQHCCILTDYVQKERKGTPLDCLQILLHDSAEAYIVDIPRPVKQFMPEYREWDHALTMCIRKWAGFGDLPIPEWQDELDSRIISDERWQLLNDNHEDWKHNVQPLGVRIEPWGARFAEQQFLARYATFASKVHGSYQYLRSGWGVSTSARYQPNFLTADSDTPRQGPSEPRVITDLIEVDIRGGVGRVVLRSENGMMVRDTEAGSFPRPAWEFIHGKFEFTGEGVDNGLG